MTNLSNKNIVVAIIGNPNIGKSTLFNSFTGSNKHVGNYPGVTVEKNEGSKIYRDHNIKFVDLPGTYSLSTYSDDEAIVRDFLLNEKIDVVINVVDAANMERNLYLFTQIMELNFPIILALNMIDVLRSQGKNINTKIMSALLDVPIFTTIANKGIGINNILKCIVDTYKSESFGSNAKTKVDYGEDIKKEIIKLEKLVSKNLELSKFHKNWLLIKLLDEDASALRLISNSANRVEILEQIKKNRNHIKERFGKRAEVEIANRRYDYVNSVVKTVVSKTGLAKVDVTEILDNLVLNKYLGIPIFLFVMYIIFKFTFVFSEPVRNIFEMFLKWFVGISLNIIPAGLMQSLIVDGIISGVGCVLGFFPLILFMFFAITFFEDSGYLARAAFVMDKVMGKFGLNGKSFLPLMLSTNGCAVPGIIATRTLESKRDRLITMFVVPFMICGAKFPVFALVIGAIFPQKYCVSMMFFMYVLSIVIALSVAKILNMIVLKDELVHFIMELPPYHLPTLKGLFLKMWERSWLYVCKAGGVIVFMSALVWVAFTYPKVPLNKKNVNAKSAVVAQMEYSIAGRTGKILDILVKPIGMDSSKAIAVISGFAAKEMIVGTLGTIYSIDKINKNTVTLKEKIAKDESWSLLKGITFLIFCLIYAPCLASVTMFFKESGSNYRWTFFMVMGNTIFAWIVSFIVFQVGKLLLNVTS
jgi:ferrous iron transport protein B